MKNINKILKLGTIYTIVLLAITTALSFLVAENILIFAFFPALIMGWFTVTLISSNKTSKADKEKILSIASITTLGVITITLIPTLIKTIS